MRAVRRGENPLRALSRRSVRRSLLLGLGVTVGLLGLVVEMAPGSLYGPVTRIVVQDDSLREADFIYVLNGRVQPRVEHAVRLYHEGWAPRILLPYSREMARRPDRPLSSLIASEIQARGVPPEAIGTIPYEGGVVDTRDEARALRSYLEGTRAESVIVITMDYHTGRADRTIRQEIRRLDVDLTISAASDPRLFTRHDWWEYTEGRSTYLAELLKLTATVICGWLPQSIGTSSA